MWRRRSAGKIEKLGFLIHVNAKDALKSWNFAWCHDMAPTCCANFFWLNWNKLLANRSFSQEGSWFQEGTFHLRVRNNIHTLPSPALIFLPRHGSTLAWHHTKFLHVLGRATMPRCLNFIPISCMGPRNSPETHMWFFSQLWCTRACACSSNLNYAH